MTRISLEEQINTLKSGIMGLHKTVCTNLEIISNYLSGGEFDKKKILVEAKTNDMIIRSLGEELERITVKILSLQAPVSRDLRLVISSFRMIYDFQRISRDTYNAMSDVFQLEINDISIIENEINNLQQMVSIGVELLRIFEEIYEGEIREHEQFDDIITKSTDLDNKIDKLFDNTLDAIVKQGNLTIKTAMLVISANRSLERYGDHICNLIERVIYIRSGVKIEIH